MTKQRKEARLAALKRIEENKGIAKRVLTDLMMLHLGKKTKAKSDISIAEIEADIDAIQLVLMLLAGNPESTITLLTPIPSRNAKMELS